MKAIQIVNFNGPTPGPRYQEAPTSESGPEQIAVDVDHVGVDYTRALSTEGLVAIDLSWTSGLGVSGRVHALGDGVDGCQVGDAVVTLTITGGGDYGQVVVAPTEFVMPLPTGLDLVLVAAIPTNSTMTLVVLEEITDLRRDESVLVHAAADSLGSQMSQVARLLGAGRVVGVTRSEIKRQEVLGLGYDEAWLTEDLAGVDPAQFDVVADLVAGPARLRSPDLLCTGGRLLALEDAPQGQDQQVSTTSPWLRGIGVIGFSPRVFGQANPGLVGSHLRHVVELMASGRLRVHATDRLPIREAIQAVTTVRAETTTSKIVLTHSRD